MSMKSHAGFQNMIPVCIPFTQIPRHRFRRRGILTLPSQSVSIIVSSNSKIRIKFRVMWKGSFTGRATTLS